MSYGGIKQDITSYMAPLRLFCIAQLKFTVAMISITSYMAPPLLVERVSFFIKLLVQKPFITFYMYSSLFTGLMTLIGTIISSLFELLRVGTSIYV